MNRTSIINYYIKTIQARSYLEIGVSDGSNFAKIQCDNKIGVDPALSSPATVHLTSDDFFAQNTKQFDVIFIDGLHHADQVKKDILNSLNVLNLGGVIICHDMNPLTEDAQIIPFRGGEWNGDCWRAFVELRQTRPDLEMFTIDCDHGVSIIKKGHQDLLSIDVEINYNTFSKYKQLWLNLISVDMFSNNMQTKINNNTLIELLKKFIDSPDDPENNLQLGLYYDSIGQTASAISYYIRTTERTLDDLIKYQCLLRTAICFEQQGTRAFSVKGMLQHAISLLPKRPEAYFLLSKFHEMEKKEGDWFLCYMLSSVGLEVCDFNLPKLEMNINYPGRSGLLFEKAVSSWWCGLCEESKNLFKELLTTYDLDLMHRTAVINNLQSLNALTTPILNLFNKDKYFKLKEKFPGSEKITQNYSESYQDMFVLTMLNGKTNGTYLEIGAGSPFYGNNTALLEKEFGWSGISLDIDKNSVDAFSKERKNKCILKDATVVDYSELLTNSKFEKNIDYLQLDCDPPETTYKILRSIPFHQYKFAVITYEHDYYCDQSKSFRNKSREYLESLGYIMVVGDIAPDEWRNYEDWWIHPDLISSFILNKMRDSSSVIKNAEAYMLNHDNDITTIKIEQGNVILPQPTPAVVRENKNLTISQSTPAPLLINPNYRNGIWIVDNFYSNPDAIREFALKQEYHQGGFGKGYIGRRTFQQFLFPGLKEEFERIMGRKIIQWEEHGMNGRFQYNSEGEPLVYHCDSQQWAGMLYLTPNAPPDTGTSTYALKGTDIRHNSHPDIMRCFRAGSQNLDRTPFEAVDNVGNVYNRLVIFNAGYLHAATGYFGFTPENSRLWQMFFFD